MKEFIQRMVDDREISWEDLVAMDLVDGDTIGGNVDAKWTIGDDTLADAERRVTDILGAGRIVTDDYGLRYIAVIQRGD